MSLQTSIQDGSINNPFLGTPERIRRMGKNPNKVSLVFKGAKYRNEPLYYHRSDESYVLVRAKDGWWRLTFKDSKIAEAS